MAVKTHSNHYFYMLGTGKIDFSANVYKAILMKTTFVFDKDADGTYAAVSADELATANGYTNGGQTLTGVSVVENDTTDSCIITWTAPVWTASGGAITHGGAIIFDDTSSDDTVIFHLASGTITVGDGATYSIDPLGVEIKQGT